MKFTTPEIEVVKFEQMDVIATSSDVINPDGGLETPFAPISKP